MYEIDFIRLKSEYLPDAGQQQPNDNVEERNPVDAEVGDDNSDSSTAKVKLIVTRNDRLNGLDFVCGICDQKYAYKQTLDRHVQLHGKSNRILSEIIAFL